MTDVETDQSAGDDPYAFNPFDPSETQHMWDLMARMRKERPVNRPTEGFVYLASHADNKAVYRDAKRFSSAEGFRAPGVVVSDEESFLGEIDPPLHTHVRRMLLRAFTIQTANAVEPWTRDTVKGILDEYVAAGGGDLIQALCVPLPGAVTAHSLGMPEDLLFQLSKWCDELLHSTWPQMNATEDGEGIAGAFPQLAEVVDQAIADHRALGDDAPDDLLTRMINARDNEGNALTDVHIRTLSVNSIAGSLSLTYMLGNLLYRYLTDPEGFTEVLRADRSLIPMAVEESLRYEPPVLFLFRTAKEDVEVGGCPVAKGERIILGMASANRDEAVYEHADEYRLDRDELPDDHLSFGEGPHLCLGNHLTRMIGKVVLEEMLDTFAPGEIRLAEGYELSYVPMFLEYGPDSLAAVVEKA
jgi:cytochrome P450